MCTHEWAYGPHGCPPRIPPKSTIIFWIKVVGVHHNFHQIFPKLNIHQRRLISIETVIGYCEDMHVEARKIFQKAENKEAVTRSDGVVMLRDSGKNSGNFSNARKAANKYNQIIRVLELAVLKDQNDQEWEFI